MIKWHGKQLLPAQAALSAFDREMQGVWIGLRMKWRPRRDAWIVADYSVGDHRTLVLSTNFPDVLIAEMPAMEWLRLDQYGSGASREDMNSEESAVRSLLSVFVPGGKGASKTITPRCTRARTYGFTPTVRATVPCIVSHLLGITVRAVQCYCKPLLTVYCTTPCTVTGCHTGVGVQ